jgi:6,7-dimethyl-8-ribityllumazine synthase
MHQPNIVILESRRFPDITEQWYNVAVGALTQQAISISRVTVPHSADLPIAFRMLLDTAHHSENSSIRSPDGYLVLGLNYKGDMDEQNHHNIWQLVYELATKAGLPFASVLEFEREGAELTNAATRYVSKIQLAIQSLVNLMMLRHQLIHPPFAAAA